MIGSVFGEGEEGKRGNLPLKLVFWVDEFDPF